MLVMSSLASCVLSVAFCTMLMKISPHLPSLPAAVTNNQNGQMRCQRAKRRTECIQVMILSNFRLSLRANKEDCERMDSASSCDITAVQSVQLEPQRDQ